jgi:hypothetical protein
MKIVTHKKIHNLIRLLFTPNPKYFNGKERVISAGRRTIDGEVAFLWDENE